MAEVGSLKNENLVYFINVISDLIDSHDLLHLADLLAYNELVPVSVREALDHMHESVPHLTKARYLIWSVYNTVGEVDYKIDKFLKVLSELPVGRKLAYKYYKKNHWYGKASKVVLKLKKVKWYEILKMLFCEYTNNVESLSDSYCCQHLKPVYLDERNEAFMILLEVQEAPHILAKKECKWIKNNEVLENQKCPLLCLQVADVTTQGTYEFYVGNTSMQHPIRTMYYCREADVTSQGTMQYPRAIINVHINCLIDKYNPVFVERYMHDNVTMADKDAWPQVSQTTYINLAVIKTQAAQDMNTFTCKTIRGDADDIHRMKGEINYRDAFEDIKHGELVIVEGRPGSGKTTLVHKISEDWARLVSPNVLNKVKKNSLKWAHIKSLFLIHLRGFCGNLNIELVDLVKCYYSNRQTVEIICDYITLKEGAGICFILDGLDEYQPTNRGNFIFKLIEKKILRKSIIIVASRPAAVAKYRSAKKHIEVLGFFKEQISEYIHFYNFSDNTVKSKSMLKQYLKERPNVYHMCYLPIQLAMICFLFDKMKGTLPETETAIYEEFTKHTILRSLYRISENSECYIRSIFTLPEPENALFLKVCALAFDKTLSFKQVLEQSEVDLVCDKMKSLFGLVTIDRASTKCGFQNLYTFCHLTLQEFLAACHIFMAKDQQRQQELVKISKQMKHMVQVLKFFCGLANFRDEGTLFKNLTDSEHFNCLTKIQCAFESHEAVTCNYVVESNVLSIEETFISARDWTALGFVLVNANDNCVKKLSFLNSGVTEEGLDAIKKTYKGNNNIEVEVLNISKIISEAHLIDFMSVFSSLCILSISVNTSYSKIISFLKYIRHPSLKVLCFLDNDNPILIIRSDCIKMFKSLVLPSFSEVKARTCASVLVDILLSSLEKHSDYFVRDLTKRCSYNFLSTPCANLTFVDVHSDESVILAENAKYDDVRQHVIYFSNEIKNSGKNHSLICYYDFVPVGSYILILCFQIRKQSKYRKLFITPGDNFLASSSRLMKKNVLTMDCSFVDYLMRFLEPLLQTHSIFFAHRNLHTLYLTNFDPQTNVLPNILSQFHFSSKYLEVDSIYRFIDNLQCLSEAIESFTKLGDVEQFRHGLALLTSKICKSLRSCNSFSKDNVGDSNSQNEDCIKVEHIILSTSINRLYFSLICTPSLKPLSGYKIALSNAMSYFNHSNLNLIQFKIGKEMLLIIKFPFIEIVRCSLFSSLKSFSKINPRGCASIVVDIILNCLDIQGAFAKELYELCSAVCATHSCVRLSLVQERITDDIYMICKNLHYNSIAAEIKLITDKALRSEDCTSNTSLHFSSFIPIEKFVVAVYLDVTESVQKYEVYIFPRDSELNLNFSDANTIKWNSEFVHVLQQLLAQQNS